MNDLDGISSRREIIRQNHAVFIIGVVIVPNAETHSETFAQTSTTTARGEALRSYVLRQTHALTGSAAYVWLSKHAGNALGRV
jgi:hypothetical protein